MTFYDGLSIGVNVSLVLVILMLGFLFSLPLKLILTEDQTELGPSFKVKSLENMSIDYRSLKLCENFCYASLIKSVYLTCNYDSNCTNYYGESRISRSNLRRKSSVQRSLPIVDVIPINDDDDHEEEEKYLNDINIERRNSSANNRKSVSIAGHILGVMLVLSAIVALVEVLRARLFETNNKRSDGSGVSEIYHGTRKCSSVVDFVQRRNVRKDTVQAQKSFEIQRMMHRSPLRLLAARPPPLLRRSSVPAQCINATDFPIKTTTGRLSRRPSFLVDSEEDSNNLTDFRRHARLIRRH